MEFFRKHAPLLVVSCLLLVNVLIWQNVLAKGANNNGTLKVFYLDIGQGDAALIEAPNGNQVLIDGGPATNKVLSELGEVMPIGDRTIDVVIATHPDADHIGGLPEVFRRYEIENYIESGNVTKDTNIVKTLEEAVAEESGLVSVIARRGMRVMLDEERGVYLDILFPDRDVSRVESNDASIIAKLTYSENCFIFSGDAPQKIENYVAGMEKNNLRCQVLKTGHHGSKTSTSLSWVGFINSEYAVISAGKNNSYKHPHREVLDILNKFGTKILRTDEQGRIEIDSDGNNVFVK